MGVIKKKRTILFSIILDGDFLPVISVLYNNTNRTISYNNSDLSFRLSGSFTNNYIMSYNHTDFHSVGIIKSSSSFIGIKIEEALSASYVPGEGMTFKIEIYE